MQVEHVFLFGEREGFADKAAEALADGVVGPLDVRRFAGFFPRLLVCGLGQAVVGLPEVGETVAAQKLVGQLAPQPLAGVHRAVTDEERDDLPVLAVLRYPGTYLVGST